MNQADVLGLAKFELDWFGDRNVLLQLSCPRRQLRFGGGVVAAIAEILLRPLPWKCAAASPS
eukprot:1162016-Pelagomonas_calceolata.AAC.1